jgi:uncharacterized protein YciU (UPF0263 family)
MKRSRKAGLIGVSSVLLLSGALPAAASSVAPSVSKEIYGNAAVTSVPLDVKTAKDAASQTVPTDTKITKDEAVKLARQYAQIPDDFTLDNVSFQSLQGKDFNDTNASWQMSFSKRIEDRYYGNVNVSISADTGKLLQFYRNYNDPDERNSYPPKTDLKNAKRLAEDYLAKMAPDELKQTRYNTTFEDNFKTD